MLKRLSRRPRVCLQCRVQKRHISGYTATVQSGRVDDENLRLLFDNEQVWKAFNQRSSRKQTGLLRNRHLTAPQGYLNFTQANLQRCSILVESLTNAASVQEYKTFARDFDRLSDLLCRVIDSVEFIRNVHPDSQIQQAATQAHAAMYEYMNVLNTHTALYEGLQRAVSIPEVTESWDDEEKATTDILIKDFKHSAIGEPDHVRSKFIQLSNNIVHTGTEMLELMAPKNEQLSFPSTALQGMDPLAVKKSMRLGSKTATFASSGRHANLALKSARDEGVRQAVYIASRAASRGSVERVERLLTLRADLARVCGYDSFGRMALSDKMAKSPEAVDKFLLALASANKPQVIADLREMQALKGPEAIQAWDRAFYTQQVRSRDFYRPPEVLASYFSLGTVIQGLSRLFSRLYGVCLVPQETGSDETWADDVRRLDVVDESQGLIAVLYCDLFARASKTPNPAHFTLRCSREISKVEIDQVQLPNPSLEDLSNILNDGMAVSFDQKTQKLHQLPTIAFVCDFSRPRSGSTEPVLLSFGQVCTLFHEMGHALHSILGRTSLQNVAGTRCATDFAELPSILMEDFFASDPAVLGLYARHWQTDELLNVDLVASELASKRHLIAAHETESQILLAALDQRLHSAEVGRASKYDSTAAYLAVYNDPRFTSVAEPAGTSWQGFFGHLYGYGAVYYSYLFDRAIAGKVWQDVFSRDPLSRDNGQRFREQVLQWGGGRDPWLCVANVLGDRYSWMRDGGAEAMAEVGRWGVSQGGQRGH